MLNTWLNNMGKTGEQRLVATYAFQITILRKQKITEISVLLYAIINHGLIHRGFYYVLLRSAS